MLNENELTGVLTPREAWDCLQRHNHAYYRYYSAAYSGDGAELRRTAKYKSFWARAGKQKVHVPIAADIAATSADMLFGEPPKITCVDTMTERQEEENARAAQRRIEAISRAINLNALLCEGAESACALGDVYLKIGWDRDGRAGCPHIRVEQADASWPEYRGGELRAIHFFTDLRRDRQSGIPETVVRAYECYLPGRIVTRLFKGSLGDLGTELGGDALLHLGLEPEAPVPGGEMAAVHIPNIRPNRKFRGSYLGRSDFDSLRGLMDELDEAYSSWMRDIRLAKARLIVPAEYLRRRPEDLFGNDVSRPPMFEFDEDVETLCAIDANPDSAEGGKITSSQFDIRAQEHAQTCTDLITRIVTGAGYAPQTFGMNIEGMAQSGTALHIREKKSYHTCAKKQAYWRDALEGLLTALVHIDAAVFPGRGSSEDVHVHVRFPDTFASDISTTAAALELLSRAQAVSTVVRVRMLHPDWTEDDIRAEAGRIQAECGIALEAPDASLGDFAAPMYEQPEGRKETEGD